MICRFFPDRFDFIVPAPKGTRLPGVRLRVRRLTRDEVIPVGGLPALTVERALAGPDRDGDRPVSGRWRCQGCDPGRQARGARAPGVRSR